MIQEVMLHQFEKHYTRDEARALLPQIRGWLKRLSELREGLEEQETEMSKNLLPGQDLGGTAVNAWVRTLVEMQCLLFEFYTREIQIKDIDRGLLDFPALRDGREVFLCWEQAEQDIEFWHDLEAGYAGRERLDEPE